MPAMERRRVPTSALLGAIVLVVVLAAPLSAERAGTLDAGRAGPAGTLADRPVAPDAAASDVRVSAAPAPWTGPASGPRVATSAIVPGSVGRSSLALDATYDASLDITWASRRIVVDSIATIRNTSGGPIDRVELNTIAAKLGGMRLKVVTVDGTPAGATVTGQTILVALGGNLPSDAMTQVRVRYRATLSRDLQGSNWLFTRTNRIIDLYRWLPWVSRKIRFERPNHGDPFETPSSRSVTVRITSSRRLTFATTGHRTSISPNGRIQRFAASDVRDFTITAAPDYRTRQRVVRDTVVRVYYRPGADGGAMLDAAADAFDRLERKLGPYPHPAFRVAQSAGAYGMESPGLIWIPTGVRASNLRYLAAHETAHQWFYGVVGSHQAREPFTDEAAADFAARHVLRLRRGSGCATARLDRRIYDYSAACYYEVVYIQGGNLLNDARRLMGPDAFWTALRGYVAADRDALVPTVTLLDALDAATPKDLSGRLFAKRFPRLY